MKHIIIPTLTVVCLLFTSVVSAQNIRKANKEFELNAYNLAIKSYRAVLQSDPNNAEALYKMAESYRHLNQIDQATEWYQKAVAQPKVDPAAYFNYGLALVNKNQYDDAKVWFTKYAETNPYVGSHYAGNVDYAKSLQGVPALYRVKREYLNKSASDFGPSFFGDRVVYSSARGDMKRDNDKSSENWTGLAMNQLFITDTDNNGYLQQPSFLRGDYKNNYNEGPVSYSENGNWVVVTKNNFVNGTRQLPTSGMKLSMYIGEATGNGDWKDAKAFAFNGSGYSTGYGHINEDGTKIYFASDRPDGYGGFDIYVTTRTGANWSSPQNLGPVVNSPGNEITPFVEEDVLYFASDWHQGLGGYDLFKADQSGGTWNRIFHLGNAINSNRDDYGLIFDNERNIGYLVSNRLGGKGNEDIYQFSQLSDNIVISVRNASDNSPISGATIDFSSCGESSFTTNEKGTYSFQALPGLECEGTVSKAGYSSSEITVNSDGRKRIQNIDVVLTREADKYLGRVIDMRDNTAVPSVFVRATDQGDGAKMETTSNDNGEYRLALQAGKTYVIRYSKAGYTDTHQRITTGSGMDKSMLGTVRFSPSSTSVSNTPLITDTAEPDVESNAGASGNPSSTVESVVGSTASAEDRPLTYEGKSPSASTSAESTEIDEEFVQKGYAVQVAAMGLEQKVDPKAYKSLVNLGNLYSRPEKGYRKLRLGIFESEAEAQAARKAAAKAGFRMAFIVNETLDDTEGLEIYSMLEEENTAPPVTAIEDAPIPRPEVETPSLTKEYLVRLAAYKNPQYFKASKVSNLGVIEQRKNGDFTIMYVAGFSNLAAAKAAQKKAQSNGFKGAYLVENKDGEYVKVEL